MEPLTLPPDDAARLAVVAQKHFGPCSAYVFACVSPDGGGGSVFGGHGAATGATRYAVLVLAQKGGAEASDAAAAFSRMSGGAQAVFLVHNPRALGRGRGCMRWFFDRVLRFGARVCLDKSNVPYIEGNPLRDVAAARAFWYKCDEVAGLCIESAAATQRLDIELARLSLLSTAAAYTAMGIVRLTAGYTPSFTALRPLLALAGMSSTLPEAFGQGEAARAIVSGLCSAPSVLRYGSRLEMPAPEFEAALGACTAFAENGRTLAQSLLASLETQHKTN